MKTQVWFDRKFSHKHVTYDPTAIWGTLICLAGEVGLLAWAVYLWFGTFKTGAASPQQVSGTLAGTLLIGLVVLLWGWLTVLVATGTWQRNIRGFVRWVITSPSGRQWEVVSPRSHRPNPKSFVQLKRVLWVGVPLGGWFHHGQIWFDDVRLPYKVMRPLRFVTNPVVILSTDSDERLLVDPAGLILKVLQSFPKDSWNDCFSRQAAATETLQADVFWLKKRVAELEEQNKTLIMFLKNKDQKVADLLRRISIYFMFIRDKMVDIKKTKRFFASKDAKRIRGEMAVFLDHAPAEERALNDPNKRITVTGYVDEI